MDLDTTGAAVDPIRKLRKLADHQPRRWAITTMADCYGYPPKENDDWAVYDPAEDDADLFTVPYFAKDVAELAVAARNALPTLLEVVEAARRWRDSDDEDSEDDALYELRVALSRLDRPAGKPSE